MLHNLSGFDIQFEVESSRAHPVSEVWRVKSLRTIVEICLNG